MEKQKNELIKEVEEKLPEFVQAVKQTEANKIVLHQDAFAADYQNDEFSLLGKAIKYAGIYGKEVIIHGVNRETIEGGKQQLLN